MSLLDLLRPKARRKQAPSTDRGILVFANTSEVIRAENLLKAGGWPVTVMGPPPELQRGCDLVVVYPLIETARILSVLEKAGNPPLEAAPLSGPLLTPVDLYQAKDFGRHLMVRAANMKITVDKETRIIVNVSGGGCPDVPWLARELTGKPLDEAESPRDQGHTLCAYALDLALKEMRRLCSR